MSTATATRPGNHAVAGSGLPAGHVKVSDRVFQKTARRAAAEVIGVAFDDVRVDIVAARDSAVVRVNAPWPIPALDDTDAVRAARPVLEAATAVQNELRSRLTRLFGREVARVDLTISGATAPRRKRVL